MKTIHLISNAHLDPVWLWPWQAGLDEALATCRSACDRLDNHPDYRFTRNEAWVYDMVERVDPALFARIRKHIESGRWEITGGWWIQPDCNAPSGWAWERQIEVGQRYFKSRFGIVPKVGYNVDSFGHAATLPKLLRDHGQEYYVMMRPQENEKALPARIFRWRGYEDGPEVIAFRIPRVGYCSRGLSVDYLKASLEWLPDGVEHSMAFIGLGDHGGGATEEQIAFLRENWDAVPGARLEFSSTQRFFDAIAGDTGKLPLVVGELQMHAVGCYTVHRGIKTQLRRAEHLVHQAELSGSASAPLVEPALLEKSWRHIAFAQFHDTLGGTCLPSAYAAIFDQLGFARSVADEALQIELRRRMTGLPDSKHQRIVAWNASDKPYKGFVEFEPWLEWGGVEKHWRLLDSTGSAVPYQEMLPEAVSNGLHRLVFQADLKAGEMRAWVLDRTPDQPAAKPVGSAAAADGTLSNDSGVAIDSTTLRYGSLKLPKPRLDLIVDKSDTWSHGIDRYAEESVAAAQWTDAKVVDAGPLMASIVQDGRIGDSRLRAEWRVYAGPPVAELRLRVNWAETFKVLKLTLPYPSGAAREDGITGGSLRRENDGKEAPVRDWTLFGEGDGRVGIALPDVFALDATAERVRLTLLRSSLLAWHDPHPGNASRGVVADQGEHEFRFRFLFGPLANAVELDNQAIAMQRPLLLADITKGMPSGVAK
ncbi:MAG: glycoside hydrolase family 38 C-terminal domain-containing protein [Capsulimonadaceae bacterium]|nr:glycoside hydrolase family 38 C-terminal domain-containing protein [Capsulimonadaceae bacterium]